MQATNSHKHFFLHFNFRQRKGLSPLLLPPDFAGRDPRGFCGKNFYLMPAMSEVPGSLSCSSPELGSVQSVEDVIVGTKTVGKEVFVSSLLGSSLII